MISDFLVALAVEAERSAQFEFIDEWRFYEEFLDGENIDLWVRVTIDGKRESIRIVPDAVFALVFEARGRQHVRVFFFEAYRDRNIVLTSWNPKRKTIFKTLLAYEEIRRQGRMKQYFAYPFTVVVTSNIPDRLETIEEFVNDNRLFQFMDNATVQREEKLLQRLLNQSR